MGNPGDWSIGATIVWSAIVGGFLIGAFFIFLPVFGAFWSPFAALITFQRARRKSLDTKRYTLYGALYSLLLIMPWIYFIRRMSGKRFPSALIRLGYVILYFMWVVSGVMGVLALTSFKLNYHSLHGPFSDYPHQAILNTAIAIYLLATVVTWIHSRRKLRRAREDYDKRSADAELQPVFPNMGFLTPFIYGFVWLALPVFIFTLSRRWVLGVWFGN